MEKYDTEWDYLNRFGVDYLMDESNKKIDELVKQIIEGQSINLVKITEKDLKTDFLIYLGQAYSSSDKEIREKRFKIACEATSKLMNLGLNIFSPVLNSHTLESAGLVPYGWSFWQKHDLPILKRCDLLLVLMFEGWETSKGLKSEIEYARENQIPILYAQLCELNGNLTNAIKERRWEQYQ